MHIIITNKLYYQRKLDWGSMDQRHTCIKECMAVENINAKFKFDSHRSVQHFTQQTDFV